MIDVCKSNLSEIRGIIPVYDCLPQKSRILHFGLGAFHRSHQAYYTAKTIQKSKEMDWGITAVGILKFDDEVGKALNSQDGLYTLIQKDGSSDWDVSLISSITKYIPGHEMHQNVFNEGASEDIAVISMTITEGGYNIDQKTKEFKVSDALVQWDLKNRNTPKTIFGFLAKILSERKSKGLDGVTLLSCDNIEHNGNVLKNTLSCFLNLYDKELLAWALENCTFPNSMVDRITPKSTGEDSQYLRKKFNLIDSCPVICEPFAQWIIEDSFIGERPKWEIAGVQFVKDVTPYEKIKLRLLNASHQAIGYLGVLHGYTYVHEAVQHKDFRDFLFAYMTEEVEDTLDKTADLDIAQYKDKIIERFSNANIADTLARICEFTSDRIPTFNLPIILEQLKAGKAIPFCALILASWLVYLQGMDEKGSIIEVVDNKKEYLQELAERSSSAPENFISDKSIFLDIAQNLSFKKLFLKFYQDLKAHGVKYSIKESLHINKECIKQ